ncbi:MAG: T9SS type A sorting domain-containing protein, partial [Candidatus Symbiothrix sp.]|nr:T9SS type A sorting domain-containing protein [Candidatus Symbiothrix sp.]
DIVGYNIYACGVKLNDDLVFGQSFVTDVSCESYTIRAYSLATGLSAESESAINVGIVPFPKTQPLPEIYPNPVKDILFIQSETPVENLTVYDLSGRICKQAGAGETTLFVGDLTSGVYVVGIKTAAGEYAEKIYIKKIE